MGALRFTFVFVIAMLIISCGRGTREKPGRALPEADYISPAAQSPAQLLARIDALSAPEGVDWKVFDTLKKELVRRLEIEGSAKHASIAPSGDFAKVADLSFDFSDKTLSWTYANLGDYDLNGETAIADITPIALHYLADTDDGVGDDALEAWVDGDLSGEVAISDITPIARNFMGEVANYRILTSAQANGEYGKIGEDIPFGAAGEFPKVFSVPLPAGASFYVKVQAMGADGSPGAESDALAIPQKADVLAVSPLEGYEFDQKTFSAAVAGTGPFNYSWDFGGGADPNTSSEKNPVVTLSSYGAYQGTVGVGSQFGGEYFPFTLTVKPLMGVLIVTPQGGSPEEQVQFKAVAKGEITLYSWKFGNGAYPYTSQVANPQVTLSQQEGTYEGSLTLYGRGSPVTFPFTYIIDAANERPRFNFEYVGTNGDIATSNRFINYPTAGMAPLMSTFDFSRAADTDGTVTTYLADLDGNELLDWFGDEPLVSHTYETPGFMLVGGRVMDDKGFIANAEVPVIAFETDPYEGAVPDSLFLLPDKWTYNVGDKMYLAYFNYMNAYEIDEFFNTWLSVDTAKARPPWGRVWAGDLFNPFNTEDSPIAGFYYGYAATFDDIVTNNFFFGYINPDGVQPGGIGVAVINEFELLSPGPLDLELLYEDGQVDRYGNTYRRPSTDNYTAYSTLGKDYGNGVTAKITVNVN